MLVTLAHRDADVYVSHSLLRNPLNCTALRVVARTRASLYPFAGGFLQGAAHATIRLASGGDPAIAVHRGARRHRHRSETFVALRGWTQLMRDRWPIPLGRLTRRPAIVDALRHRGACAPHAAAASPSSFSSPLYRHPAALLVDDLHSHTSAFPLVIPNVQPARSRRPDHCAAPPPTRHQHFPPDGPASPNLPCKPQRPPPHPARAPPIVGPQDTKRLQHP